MIGRAGIIILAICLSGCGKEAHTLGPTVPQTSPVGDRDPRITAYQDNVYQLAQGGRYFAWYGCAGCHTEEPDTRLNLADRRWKNGSGFAHVFHAIADGHGALSFGTRVPPEQLWQLTAFVRDLPLHFPEKRRRLNFDQKAEPQGSSWTGPQ